MDNRMYGYARVSTREQNEDRQLEALTKFGVPEQNIIIDKASGKDTEREGYQYLKRQILRQGDTLVIKELDRLSRNKADVKRELEEFKVMGIRVKILDIPTTLTDFARRGNISYGTNKSIFSCYGFSDKFRINRKTGLFLFVI